MTNKPIATPEPGKILITGGCGFIGSNLAAHYLAKGWEVVVYDNFARLGAETNAAWLADQAEGRLSIVIGDIRNFSPLCEAVQGADIVAHLAAQVAVTGSVADPREDFMVNALGGFNLLEAVRGCGSDPIVLYASTNKVYGELGGLGVRDRGRRYEFADELHGVSETFPLDLHSPYGCSKGASDQYMLDYARIYGLKTVVFRQSCIYGPRQFGVEDQGWVAHFMISAVTGRPITFFGDGKQVRDILHVDDLIAAFEAAISNIELSQGQVYNLGGGPQNSVSLLELVGRLEDQLGRPVPLRFQEWRPGDQKVYISDIRKAENELGWSPVISVDEGLNELQGWVEANRDLFKDEEPVDHTLPSRNAFMDTRPTGVGHENRATPLPSLNAAESKARQVKAVTAGLKETAE